MPVVRARYEVIDDRTVRVRFSIGPDERHLRDIGELDFHPVEFNALDRLLHAGHRWEKPGHVYDGPPQLWHAVPMRLLDPAEQHESEQPLGLARGAHRG